MSGHPHDEARELATETLEWIAEFRAGSFDVVCHKCWTGFPYLPPELFGLIKSNEKLANNVLASLAREEAERERAERAEVLIEKWEREEGIGVFGSPVMRRLVNELRAALSAREPGKETEA